MKDDLPAAGGSAHPFAIANVRFDDANALAYRGQVFWPTRGEVIQHRHLSARLHQRLGQMRADETRAPGDEDRFTRPGAHADVLRAEPPVDPSAATPLDLSPSPPSAARHPVPDGRRQSLPPSPAATPVESANRSSPPRSSPPVSRRAWRPPGDLRRRPRARPLACLRPIEREG